jgi:hypothetical protein
MRHQSLSRLLKPGEQTQPKNKARSGPLQLPAGCGLVIALATQPHSFAPIPVAWSFVPAWPDALC